jgi:hypothetical protein
MTHTGGGRIARARLSGKTAGSNSTENKNAGLNINSKETKPVDFGEVIVGTGKIVRSTLLINDSADPITIYSVDVIEADNGLQKLEQGCAANTELPSGASCPVTLLWEPKENIPVSTDLIVRHSGKLGFAVVPVRGTAKGGTAKAGSGNDAGKNDAGKNDDAFAKLPKGGVPLPPSAHDLEKEVAGKLAPVSDSSFGGGSGNSALGNGKLYLIGTIGDRALFLLPNGETAMVSPGDSFEAREGTAKLVSVGAHSADITIGAKKMTLQLEAAPSLVSAAMDKNKKDDPSQKSSSSKVGGK